MHVLIDHVIDHLGNVDIAPPIVFLVLSAGEELLTHIPSTQLTEAINGSPTDKPRPKIL
jgi:hypothetical protein